MKEHIIMHVLIVIAALIIYNLLVKKFLPASFEENYEVDNEGRMLRVA